VPLFGSSYQKPPKKKPVKINKVVKLDGKPRKVGDGRSWIDVLLGTGKKK
jgi:hypothetical protein